ncbi:hypothetical protein [Nonlabens tegetincola]|uniref:hypothetical protein n=1 Tax=Nonlabens tegetincola TaxID=323273 RepID=UPI0030C8C51C
MKKHTYIIILSVSLIVSAFAKAQSQPSSSIKAKGRFIKNNIELRFFPDRKSTMKLAFQSGFIIERAIENSTQYTEIGRTKPFTAQQWQAAMDEARTEEERNEIELAKDFYEDILEDTGGSFEFTEGIGELKQQKAGEDFQLMISLLTAIKNPVAAQGLGFAYTDNTAELGANYVYRIELVAGSDVYQIQPGFCTVNASSTTNLTNKVYVKTGDTELGFVWDEHPDISGVDVERTINGKNVKLNDAPIYSLNGKDYAGPKRSGFDEDSLINYQEYTYRFYGYTVFGERVQFAEVTGMPRDLTPPQQPFLKQPQHIKPDEVLVEWEMKATIASDFKGFAISRSQENKGNFQLLHDKLLPPSARKFTDKSFIVGKTNYYLVQAVDTANNISSSFPVSVTLIDSIPPVKPVFIDGKIDSTGVVTVRIKKNDETDLMGYRLYRSNASEHEFSAIKEGFKSIDSTDAIVQTVFKDTVTLKSLTPKIYYKIEALDFNHNTSKFSDVLIVKRPDTIAPTTPVFKRVKSTKDGIELRFSLSKSRDVKEHVLYRKTDLKASWESYEALEIGQESFVDKKANPGTVYYYSLRAIDDSGNKSHYASAVQGKVFTSNRIPPVENLRITSRNGKTTLTWNYKNMTPNIFFIIYKKNKEGQFVQHGKSYELSFNENVTSKINYAIKVFSKDGRQSKLSDEVKI